jgi:hypothetical protein
MKWFGTLLLFVAIILPTRADQKQDESSLSVFPGGMGIHTLVPSPRRLIELMPRRVDKDGRFVLNPGLGLIYRTEGYQFQTLYIKDSFNNDAAAVTAGYEFETGYTWLDLGASLGIYVRESPAGCYTFSDGVYCYTDANEIPLLYHADMGGKKLDVAILPLFSIGTHFPMTKSTSIQLSLNSAVFLSFLTLGLRFDL